MYKIAILGCENSHANTFLDFIITQKVVTDVEVVGVYRQINPDVFPAFPITPSTEIPQYFASFVANGQVDTEFITVEFL